MNKRHLACEFFRYTACNVFGMIGLSVYILADTFFIAQALGSAGLAALNLAIPIYNAVFGLGAMLGTGAAIACAVAAGRGEDGAPILHAVLRTALILSLIFLFAGIFFSRPIAGLLGADDATFAMTEIYLRVILFFSPAFIINYILQCAVRADGNPRLAMLSTIGGSLFNILFDYIFLFPCRMGMFGAVLATGFSPIASLLILAPHLYRRRHDWFSGTADNRALPRVLSLGLPAFITEASSGAVMMVFNWIMLTLGGNLAVAAYGVIANLAIVTNAIFSGIAQGVQPLFSREHGAGHAQNLRFLCRYAGITALAMAILLYGLLAGFAAPITAVFNSENDPALAAIAIPGLRLYFAALPAAALNILICGFLAAVERARAAQLLTVGRGLAVIIPVACLLAVCWQMTGAWLAYPVTELLMLAAGGFCFAAATKKRQISL